MSAAAPLTLSAAAPAPSWRERWEGFWLAAEPRLNLEAARVVLAATALWVVLSRFDLPSLLELPPEMYSRVGAARRFRFVLVLPLALERGLYVALHLCLVAALVGYRARAACLASGLLLYHFAPVETLVRTANPYLRGLTLPALGLLLWSFSPATDARGGHSAPGWPLRLVQVVVCQVYVFAAYAKLVTSGWAWATGDNVRGYLLVLNQLLVWPPEAAPGLTVASSPVACWTLAVGGIAFELLFPLVLLWPRTRVVLLPMAFAFHVANAVLFRIFFQNVWLLLLFVDWDKLRRGRP